MYLTWDEYNLNEMKLHEQIYNQPKIKDIITISQGPFYFLYNGNDIDSVKFFDIKFGNKVSLDAHSKDKESKIYEIFSKVKILCVPYFHAKNEDDLNKIKEALSTILKPGFDFDKLKKLAETGNQKEYELLFEGNLIPKYKGKTIVNYYVYGRTESYSNFYIDKEQIKSIKEIDSVSKHDTGQIAGEISLDDLSKQTIKFLDTYMKNPSEKRITLNVMQDFAMHGLTGKEPLILFRGMTIGQDTIQEYFKTTELNKGDIIKFKNSEFTSWSKNKAIAYDFAHSQQGATGVVMKIKVEPKDVIVDTTLLSPDSLTKLYHTKQREVIIKKGAYNGSVEAIIKE